MNTHSNLTFGKKIALGFAVLIAIMAILGIVVSITMRSVETAANALSSEYVPESSVSGDLGGAVAEVQLAARSYGFTADPSYLEAARKALADVHKHVAEAKNLADLHPDLVKLIAHLKELGPVLKQFEDLIDETEANTRQILTEREKMNQAANEFLTNIDKLIEGQNGKMEKEMVASTDAAKLQMRRQKLMLAFAIRSEGSAARVAAFKSQALRDPAVMDEGLKGFEAMEKNFAELREKLTSADDIAELKVAQENAHVYRESMKEIAEHSRALAEIGKRRLSMASSLQTIADETRLAGATRTKDAATASSERLSTASRMMAVGMAFSLGIGVVVAFFIIRGTKSVLTEIAGALVEGSQQVASASEQVAAASQSLAEGASEQAASLEETSASLEEMSSMTQRNAENVVKVSDLARQARVAADAGSSDMQIMASAMQEIRKSSDDIAKIIKTIDEIAFQTNILALNAAVEAARAGEAGMGFAVVADEVRNLAQRAAQAARETSGMIENAVNKTAQGAMVSEKVSRGLAEIVTKARQVDELIAEVANASKEQAQGISQVGVAVTQMDKVTQSTAASAEESASAAEELSSQAEALKVAVQGLNRLVFGGKEDYDSAHALELGMEQFSPTKPRPHNIPGVVRPNSGRAMAASHHVGGPRGIQPNLSVPANGRVPTPVSDDDFRNF